MAIDADRIRKPVRKLRKFLKELPKRPSCAQIHRLRTSARRFETTVESLGVHFIKNRRRLLRDLGKIRKRAGRIRDMDVLTGHALTANLHHAQDGLVRLLETLGVRREKHVKKLRSLIGKVGSPLRRRLKRAATKLEAFLSEPADRQPDSTPEASTVAAAKALRLAEELKFPLRLDKKHLHPYRLKVKQLRDILLLASHAEQQKFVNTLGQVKDAIGEWHDWDVLTSIANEALDQDEERKLLPMLHAISEKKFLHALSLTNHMRQSYLHASAPQGRTVARGRKLAAVTPTVFAATSAISA